MPKITNRLTDIQIKKLKPRDTAFKVYDEGSLRLLVRPSGTKVWQYPYQFDDKYNVFTIGQYPSVSIVDARQERDRIKKLLKEGVNPNQHKQSTRLQNITEHKNTFQSVAMDWYSKQEWAEKHAKNILSRLEKDVFKEIGSRPIASINVPDIIAILKNIENRKAYDVAQRINQYCSEIFEYGIAQNLCKTNPAMGRAKFIKKPERKNRKHLKEDQLHDYLQALENDDGNPLINLAAQLIMHTFLRPTELRAAQWKEIDEDNAQWIVPAERMKKNSRDMRKEPHIVPLSTQSLAIIKRIRTISGDSEFLFPSKSKPNQPFSDVTFIKCVKRLTDGKATPHGFRHTASTILNEHGFDPRFIDKQMAHIDKNRAHLLTHL